MEEYRVYNYTNDTGYHKRLCVYPPKDGKYHCELWERDHGEFCGSGDLTAEEINTILEHYGITDRI